jgi:hypothetical protein
VVARASGIAARVRDHPREALSPRLFVGIARGGEQRIARLRCRLQVTAPPRLQESQF